MIVSRGSLRVREAPTLYESVRPSPSDAVEGYSLENILAILRRRLGSIILVTLAGTALAVLAWSLIPPLYEATAVVSVEEGRAPRSIDIVNGRVAEAAAAVNVDTKIELISSRPLLAKVMDTLDLRSDSFFNPPGVEIGLPEPWRSLASILPRDLLVRSGLAHDAVVVLEAREPDSSTSPAADLVEQAAVDRLLKQLEIWQPNEAQAIRITSTWNSPEKAAAIANTVAETFVRWESQDRQDRAGQSSLWLDQRLQELKGAVERSEQAVTEFRLQHQLAMPSAAGGTLNDQRLTDLNNQLVAVRAEQLQVRAQLDRARRSRGGEAVPAEAYNSPMVVQLRMQQSDLQRRQVELAQTYGDRHPQIVAVKAQIREVEQKIRAELGQQANQAVRDLEGTLGLLASRQKSIEDEVQALGSGNTQDRQAEVQLRELERQATATRALYEGLLSRQQEAREEVEAIPTGARVLSLASPPERALTPGVNVFAMMGFTASLMFGSILAMFRERLDRRVQNARQLERQLGIPALGLLPHIRQRRIRRQVVRYIAQQPSTFLAEAAQSILTELNVSPGGPSPTVIMVTSALPQEGKTTLALSLAAAAVHRRLKVAVVDLDLRRPSVLKSLDRRAFDHPSGQRGLQDYLAGKVARTDIVHHDRNGVDVIPAGRRSRNPLKHFQGPVLPAFFRALRAEYDLVIVDTAPVLAASETKIAMQFVEHIVLAARWKATDVAAVGEAVRLLSGPSHQFVGFVQTMVDIEKYSLYSRGEAGSYYRSYQKYYGH